MDISMPLVEATISQVSAIFKNFGGFIALIVGIVFFQYFVNVLINMVRSAREKRAQIMKEAYSFIETERISKAEKKEIEAELDYQEARAISLRQRFLKVMRGKGISTKTQ